MMRLGIRALAIALLISACRSDRTTAPEYQSVIGVMPIEVAIGPGRVDRQLAQVVARVVAPHGGTIEFLDLGDGHIGIGERAPRYARSIVPRLLQTHDATALEIFEALKPRDAAAPALLVREHQQRVQRSASGASRLLPNADMVAADLQTPGFEFYACDPFGADWVNDWKAAFVGITMFSTAKYMHQQTGSVSFGPGVSLLNPNNTNSKTYLGACNGDDYDDLSFEVLRRIFDVWFVVHQVNIGNYEKYTFYSSTAAKYRGRTQGVGGSTVEHYGIGVAWTPTFTRVTQ